MFPCDTGGGCSCPLVTPALVLKLGSSCPLPSCTLATPSLCPRRCPQEGQRFKNDAGAYVEGRTSQSCFSYTCASCSSVRPLCAFVSSSGNRQRIIAPASQCCCEDAGVKGGKYSEASSYETLAAHLVILCGVCLSPVGSQRGVVFGCHNSRGGDVAAVSWEGPGMLLNIPRCAEQVPTPNKEVTNPRYQ